MNCQLGFFIVEVSFDEGVFIADAERNCVMFLLILFHSFTLLTTKECYRLIVQGSKRNNMHELN